MSISEGTEGVMYNNVVALLDGKLGWRLWLTEDRRVLAEELEF